MDLAELCHRIELPAELTDRVLTLDRDFDQATIANETHKLLRRATWEQAIKNIQETLGDDPAGVKILACLLRCACQTHQTYREKGIPETIFVDTMKFFSRFVNFHQEVYGYPAFTWGWWVPRQLSLNEFRIGSLEYETVETDTDRKIYIHIASDSDLTLPRLRESYTEARKFFADFFPAYKDADMVCESWMLCPVLKNLLPPSSRILAFQRSFEIYKSDPENDGFLRWIYGRKDTPFTDLPETTSLQRKMKTFLLKGGKIGWAHGKLVQNPFTDC